QKSPDLGIPNRFKLTSSRFSGCERAALKQGDGGLLRQLLNAFPKMVPSCEFRPMRGALNTFQSSFALRRATKTWIAIGEANKRKGFEHPCGMRQMFAITSDSLRISRQNAQSKGQDAARRSFNLEVLTRAIAVG
ncbi:hypothetical protein ACFFWD_23045, partial [Bradyrhizobium erythrophlei]|uniref:hypothetical protein n=1 Tax=Bradyrhizobium erythrophlei TaxID=1437360 RepID=UPI0035F0A97D